MRDAIVLATGRGDCGAVSEFDLLDVAVLDLEHQGITTLDAGDFTGLSSMTELRLPYNRLGTIPDQAFRDLVNLKELHLRDTDLTAVPVAIRGLSVLQELDLMDNGIEDLHRDAFKGLSELRYLWLWRNRITTLPDGVFGDLGNLRYLYLGANRITRRTQGGMAGAHGPISIGLERQPARRTREDVFASIPNVLDLILNGTQLEAVPPRVFAGLTDLDWLYLSDNRIDDLSGVVFPASTMSRLELENNALQAIPAGMFAGFTSVACARRQMDLNLSSNPGSPFPLTLELDRIDAGNATAGPASVVVRVREGAPWPITVRVATTGGSPFTREVTVTNGSVKSEPFEVAGGGSTVLRLASRPDVPPTYQGVRIVLGDDLRLF